MTGTPPVSTVAGMSSTGGRAGARLLGLRRAQSGQSAIEYLGLLCVVFAIVGALMATGIGTTISERIEAQVCRIGIGGAGGGGTDCGGRGGRGDQAGGSHDKGLPGKGLPADDGDPDAADADAPTSPTQLDYAAALKNLQDARTTEKSDSEKVLEAAKELAKILADELGITDALDCITKGDMGACTATLVNVLLSLIGGAVGKLAAKYGAPWKWKKAVGLVKALRKHGGELYDALTTLLKNRKKVGEAEKRLAAAKRKLEAEQKARGAGKPGGKPGEKPGEKPPTCAVSHSFPPGTPVLLGDGRRVAIEAVRTGDRVEATDPLTGRTAARRVTRTFTTHDDKDFTRLTVRTPAGTAVVTATDTHPFWLAGRQRWADAGDIVPGAALRTERGRPLTVLAVRRYERVRTTYDLEVEGAHTYYVGVGAATALVHNVDCEWPVADDVPGPAAGKVLKRPNKRHTVKGSVGAEVKEANTVILDGMQQQVDDDIKAIAQGKARLDADGNTYHVNGRTYEVKANGTVFPKGGPGLVKLDRVEYSALQLLAKGDAKSLKQLQMDPKFKANPQAVEKARAIVEGTYK